MTPPRTVAQMLQRPLPEPGRPRVTWYGPDGERIELSGAVVANWVAKTTNLLVEEHDAGPGTRVRLDLPPHWRTLVWALAAWRCGADVVLGAAAGTGDVVVTDRPAEHADAPALVAVALPALARSFEGDLPAGAVDAAGAVMTYGDVIGWAPEVDPSAAALELDTLVVPHADLLAWAAVRAPVAAEQRVLVRGGAGRTDDLAMLLARALAAFDGGGSVVLVEAEVAEALDAEPERLAALVATEIITNA